MQYDVELVHKIEGLIGHELQPFELEESAVLKGISKVFKAHRKAAMQAAEHQQAAEQSGRANHGSKRKKRVGAADR